MPASLAEVLAACIQPTEPQTTIVKYMKERHGQRFRDNLKGLREATGQDSLKLEVIDNAHWLTWGTEETTQGVMLVNANMRRETIIDADWVVTNNDHLFKRVWENNELRKQAIKNPNNPTLVRVEQLLLEYKELSMELEKVFAYPNNLWHDKEAIQAAYGLRFDTLREYPF